MLCLCYVPKRFTHHSVALVMQRAWEQRAIYMNKGHFSFWLCLSSSPVLLPSNLSPSPSPSFPSSPFLSTPNISNQCRGPPTFFLPPPSPPPDWPSWRQMGLWLTGGNTGLCHGVKGVNRSGGFKVLQGKVGVGGCRDGLPNWVSCSLHISTLGGFLWGNMRAFVGPDGSFSGWALCRAHLGTGWESCPLLTGAGWREEEKTIWLKLNSWSPCCEQHWFYILGSLCLGGVSSWFISECGKVNGHFRVMWAKFCSQMQVHHSCWICKSFRKAAFDPVQDL